MSAANNEIDLPSRAVIIRRLREEPATVDELTTVTGLTANAIRSQLAVLERDGTVERAGIRRAAGAGKPPNLFRITPAAEREFSTAYPAALAALTAQLSEQIPATELFAIFSGAGARIGATMRGSEAGDAATAAAELLTSLGAIATVAVEAGGKTVVSGVACPLTTAVRECTDTCELVRAMLAQATGATVLTECSYTPEPRCRFHMA